MSAVLALLLLLSAGPSLAQETPKRSKHAPRCPEPERPDPKSRTKQLDCLLDWFGGHGKKAEPDELEKQKTKARDILGDLLSYVERAGGASEEAKRQAAQHYLSGIIFFQKGDYGRAREEWTLSRKLDPANDDAKAGLARLDKIEED